MSIEMFEDEEGNAIRVKRIHKGRFIPTSFVASGTERMHETKLRPDDLFIFSYPKAGCHWLWENLRFIIDEEIKFDHVEKDDYMMDQHEFGHVDKFPSPRILNNHALLDDQPAELFNGNHKVVFLYRNPKDTVVSFYHHSKSSNAARYDGTFSGFLKLFCQGKTPYNYFEYMQTWHDGLLGHPEIPRLFVRYEDLHKNPIGERRKISEFLGKSLSDEFLQEVAEATSIEKMKETKKESLKGRDGTLFMYRKGKIGNWKDHFTVSESEWFDEVINKQLGELDLYQFIYE